MKSIFKRSAAVFLILIMIFTLSGCGIAGALFKMASGKKPSDNATDPVPTPETDYTEPSDTDTDNAEAEPTPTPSPADNGDEGEDETLSASDDIRKLPDIYLRGHYNNHWMDDDTHQLVVDFNYQLLLLGKESEAKYPELAKKIMIVNDLISTDEGNLFMSNVQSTQKMKADEIEEAVEDGRMPYKAHWNIYARRTDEEITSFVVRNTLESGFDYDRILFTGYNFRTATGEELSLSDIVKDEDAFLEIVGERVKAQIMEEMPDLYEDDSDIPDLREYLNTGARGNWTLDPQGVTVWLDSYTFMPFDIVVPVLFSEDKDGTIFADEFKDHSPEEWIMSFPLYDHICFDADDDGESDDLIVYENKEYYGEDDPYGCVTGLTFVYNGEMNEITGWDDMYNSRLSLIHKGGSTYVLNTFSEYDYGFMNTYSLSGSTVKDNGYVVGHPSTIPYEEVDDDDYMVPDHLLTDPYDIMLTCPTNALSTCGAKRRYEITDKGELSPVDPFYTIIEDAQHELTLLMDIPGVHIVDEDTFEPTDRTVDLKKGDKIKMEYTDEVCYVDFRTKEGDLVRIEYGFDHDDGYKYVCLGVDGIANIYDVFDGMFWAG